jgi:hypothetical protein
MCVRHAFGAVAARGSGSDACLKKHVSRHRMHSDVLSTAMTGRCGNERCWVRHLSHVLTGNRAEGGPKSRALSCGYRRPGRDMRTRYREGLPSFITSMFTSCSRSAVSATADL